MINSYWNIRQAVQKDLGYIFRIEKMEQTEMKQVLFQTTNMHLMVEIHYLIPYNSDRYFSKKFTYKTDVRLDDDTV